MKGWWTRRRLCGAPNTNRQPQPQPSPRSRPPPQPHPGAAAQPRWQVVHVPRRQQQAARLAGHQARPLHRRPQGGGLCLQATYYSLPTYLLLTAYYYLLTTHYSLLTAYCSLLTTYVPRRALPSSCRAAPPTTAASGTPTVAKTLALTLTPTLALTLTLTRPGDRERGGVSAAARGAAYQATYAGAGEGYG